MVQFFSAKSLLGIPAAGLICFAGAWSISAAQPSNQEPTRRERSQDQGEHRRPERAERGEHAEHGEGEHSPLENSMKVLQRSMKAMRPMLADFENNQANIVRALSAMEGAMIQSLGQTPPRPEGEMSEGEWAEYQIRYRQGMTASLALLLETELAALKGDAATVTANLRQLNESKKKGHDAFKQD
ncbi:MAG: hypothetical protein KDB61_08430 [Planctomycetes bacterium]|nr:hypothetical protein [Planctomycetota bacterium]